MVDQTKPGTASRPLALVPMDLDPQALIKSAIEHKADVGTLERLFALANEIRQQRAKEAWNTAMVAFQKDCPAIKDLRTTTVRSKRTDAAYSFTWAPLRALMNTIEPAANKRGLGVSFRLGHDGGLAVVACRISHELGHYEESGEVAIPIPGDEGSGANAAQRVGVAHTYGKRYSLLAITGLVADDTTDAQAPRSEPAPEAAPAEPSEPKKLQDWSGQILGVEMKSGTTGGKSWTRYDVKGDGGQVFQTFKKSLADFAREAGSSLVRIVYHEDRYGKGIVGIEPTDKLGDK